MQLYLVQHADAVTTDVDLSDQGRADVTRLSAWLDANDVAV